MKAEHIAVVAFFVMIFALVVWAVLYRIHKPSSEVAMLVMAACLGVIILIVIAKVFPTGEIDLRSFRHIWRVVYREQEPFFFFMFLGIFTAIGLFLTAIIPAALLRIIKRLRSRHSRHRLE
jgi:hypothetical protein